MRVNFAEIMKHII